MTLPLSYSRLFWGNANDLADTTILLPDARDQPIADVFDVLLVAREFAAQ